MRETFYFYDLETTGLSSKNDRIMQFAGQRTDLDLNPIGPADDVLIQLTPDVLPDPEALLVTSLTPQQTLQDGLREHEFVRWFDAEIATPGTIFTGFNSLRFDDEFMRAIHYRNLADVYEWQWKDSRSKWDMLDVLRMTRALRPEGIEWVSEDGKPVNKLEVLASANNIVHTQAHNALSDVEALIGIAQLINNKQPKLFKYLLNLRNKHEVKQLLAQGKPVVYSSGRYANENEKTTVVIPLICDEQSAVVYDLRVDPVSFLERPDEYAKVPVIKEVKYNHCPAMAPLGVVTDAAWERIKLDLTTVNRHLNAVKSLHQELVACYVPPRYEKDTSAGYELVDVDGAMHDGFYSESDRRLLARTREMSGEELTDFHPEFSDKRLNGLYFLYKARQFPRSLLAEDRALWDEYLRKKLLAGEENSPLALYMQKVAELRKIHALDSDKCYILDELTLYAQSIMPLSDD